jgi:hypothetical protein
VIVRRRILRAVVLVRKHAELELRVLIKHLALGGLLRDKSLHEVRVAQQLLQAHADLAASRRARFRIEDGPALAGELL